MILALWQFLYIASSRKMLFERNFEVRTKFVYFKYIIGQNGATYANIDELLRQAIQIGALNEIGTIREKMGEFGEGY